MQALRHIEIMHSVHGIAPARLVQSVTASTASLPKSEGPAVISDPTGGRRAIGSCVAASWTLFAEHGSSCITHRSSQPIFPLPSPESGGRTLLELTDSLSRESPLLTYCLQRWWQLTVKPVASAKYEGVVLRQNLLEEANPNPSQLLQVPVEKTCLGSGNLGRPETLISQQIAQPR